MDNQNVNNLNHLQLLENLDISNDCGVNQEGISGLKKIRRLWKS